MKELMNVYVSYFLFRRQRANRQDIEESILQRDRSVNDISRSENQYLNAAYDENCDERVLN